LRSLSIPYRRLFEGVARVVDVASSEQRILPARRVRKPSDCPVPCLASKLVINSTLLMAWEAMSVPADRTPLGRVQSFHLLIGVARKSGRRSGETRRVGRAKAFDKEGDFCSWQSAARVKESGCRLGILWEAAAYSERKGWTLTITATITNERRPL
jgi:hypothetical protein